MRNNKSISKKSQLINPSNSARRNENSSTSRTRVRIPQQHATKPAATSQAEPCAKPIQENLLCLLHWKDEGKSIVDNFDPALFEGDYRDIAERAVDYWQKYRKPPCDHSADLFDDVLSDEHNRRQNTYRRILTNLAVLKDSINVPYVEDQLRDLKRLQRVKKAIIQCAELADQQRIDEAIELFRSTADNDRSGSGLLSTRTLDQFEAQETSWLWSPFIPLRQITTVFGPSGVGKSSICLDLAVRIVRGGKLPLFDGEEPEYAPQGSVLLLTKEDDPASMIRPRLEAMGAKDEELKKIHFVGDDSDPECFAALDRIDTKMRQLENKIAALGDVKLLLIDPISDFAGKTDLYRDDQVRALLTPLAAIARRHDLAVIIVLHMNKKEDLSARNRALGGVAFINVPRAVIAVGVDPEDETRKIMVTEKRNLTGKTYAAAFEMTTARTAHKIIWHSERPRDVTPDQVLELKRKKAAKIDRAKTLLDAELSDGPVAMIELQKLAAEQGISRRTLENAKAALGVESYRRGDRWFWSFEAPLKTRRRTSR